MERLTRNNANGKYVACEGVSGNKVIEKLARFEDMYDALIKERDKIAADMEKLRCEGKTKTATYKQIFANKLMTADLIARFDLYGL